MNIKSVPFRCRRLLSAGRKSSFLGCACGISTFPPFPQESSAFRFNALRNSYFEANYLIDILIIAPYPRTLNAFICTQLIFLETINRPIT